MLCQNGLFSSAIHCSARYSSYAAADGEMDQINFMSEHAFLKWGDVVVRLVPNAVELIVHASL